MDASAWLAKTAPGSLNEQERGAIKDFTLLWSLYEGTILNNSANANAIIRTVRSLKNDGKLSMEPLRPAIKHFLDRYYDGIDLTHHFYHLHLRSNDHPDLVERVVRRQSSDDVEILSALLIMVFRLRNNLFHGIKWSYEIQGQLENFRNANNLLMTVMEMHRA
jgi:hypothetical protein